MFPAYPRIADRGPDAVAVARQGILDNPHILVRERELMWGQRMTCLDTRKRGGSGKLASAPDDSRDSAGALTRGEGARGALLGELSCWPFDYT